MFESDAYLRYPFLAVKNAFALHPQWEHPIMAALVLAILCALAALIQRYAYPRTGRAFWVRMAKNPLSIVIAAGALMGAFSTPIPGTYTFNCIGTASSDTPEIVAALGTTINRFIVPVGTCAVYSQIQVNAAAWTNKTITGVDRAGSVIQAAAGTNLGYMFQGTASGTASKFTMSNLTIDANYGNQTAGNGSAAIAFAGAITYSDITIDGVRFLNCGAYGCIQFGSTAVSDVLIENSTFNGSYCRDIYATKTTQVRIVHNYFTGYNQQVTADCPAIGGYSQSGYALSGWVIEGNTFNNTVSEEFSIEFVPATSTPANNMAITGNTFEGNGLGGGGISIACDQCSIVGNSFHGQPLGDRGFCECGGNGLVISANAGNGQISLTDNTTAYGSTGPSGILVTGNTIYIAATPTANSSGAIFASSVNHVDITNNTIVFNMTGSTYSYDGIFLGFYGGIGPVSDVVVRGNHITDISATPQLQGIRLSENSSNYSNRITIRDNDITGAAYGLYFNTGTTYSTNIVACGNDLTGSTNKFNGLPTNTGDMIGNFPCMTPAGMPSYRSGFGTGAFTVGNWPGAFTINVGTGSPGTSGSVNLPTAQNGWVCAVSDNGAFGTQFASATTTYAQFDSATAWSAGTTLSVMCNPY